MKYVAGFFAFLFGCLTFLLVGGILELNAGLIEMPPLPIVLVDTEEYWDALMEIQGQDIGILLVVILFFTLFAYCNSLRHRLSRKKKATLSKDDIKGPFVLYLRSFKDDATTWKSVSPFNDTRSEEEVLVSVMSDVAPVYAIGDPKDKKMPLGASRLYVDDEHWKSTVEDLANRAVLVVLRLGKTDSFWWEVEMALRNIPVEKILFVVPQSKTFDNVATLYKMLLQHGIDLQDQSITVEKKRRGSISSFLFFDKDGTPHTAEVKVPRFSRIVMSYENMLRNSLSEFRQKFGLSGENKRAVRLARISQIVIVFYAVITGCGNYMRDYNALRNQWAYEISERCVELPSFVSKYSDEVSPTNMVYCIVEALKGLYCLDDENTKTLFAIEAYTLDAASRDEFEQVMQRPYEMPLMVKKYCPDDYQLYVEILCKAAIFALENEELAEAMKDVYADSADMLPVWVDEMYDEEDGFDDEYDFTNYINQVVVMHFDDEDIADVIKTFVALNSKNKEK